MFNNPGNIRPGQRWQHYKGGVYEIITLARRESDGKPVVCYQNVETLPQKENPSDTENDLPWIRDYDNFLGVTQKKEGDWSIVNNRFVRVSEPLLHFTVEHRLVATRKMALTGRQILQAAGFSEGNFALQLPDGHLLYPPDHDTFIEIKDGMMLHVHSFSAHGGNSLYSIDGVGYYAQEVALPPEEVLVRHGYDAAQYRLQVHESTGRRQNLEDGIPVYLDQRHFLVETRPEYRP